MKKNNEKELKIIFQGIKDGNKEDIELLYKNYHSIVYGVAFSILKNKENSEDVTQNVFTKILKMDPSLLPTQGEASWLYVVTKNEVMQFLRKQKITIDIDDMYTLESESNEIDDLVDMTAYYRLLEGLKPIDKEIISLRILSDMTFEKISQMLNMPIGTVEWRYYKALHHIKASAVSLVAFILVLSLEESQMHFLFSEKSTNDTQVEYEENESLNSIEDKESTEMEQSEVAKEAEERNSSFWNDTSFVDSMMERASDNAGIEINSVTMFKNLSFYIISVVLIILFFLTMFFTFKKKIKIKK